ncbi:hypothetical protein AUP68_03668 [Ilyonectria robusta]
MNIIKVAKVSRIINVSISRIWDIAWSFGCEALRFPSVVTSSLEGYGVGPIGLYGSTENRPSRVRPSLSESARKDVIQLLTQFAIGFLMAY